MHLRIATTRPLPEPDVDEDLLLAALRARGVAARMAAWNDPRENWDERIPTLIRSTWDYIHDLDGFLAWADRAQRAAPLWNDRRAVRWNAHKGYLDELARAGHAVVPTEFLARGARAQLGEIVTRRGWRDVVIKPTVSAGSFGTRRFRTDEAAHATSSSGGDELAAGQRFLDELVVERDVLVQRYVDSVDGHGERSLVWIDGAFTHSIRKTPRFAGQEEQVSAALAIDADALALATSVLNTCARRIVDSAPPAERAGPCDLIYARVDVARDVDDRPMVMEVELIEPSLFLQQSPAALRRFVDAVAHRLAARER